ncbi:inorganic polyphosphate kinase [Flavobacterium psychrophilum]|nr:inorganic polyphosphate kinase [Flavobacterium psychrophilum]AOE53232.1 inorganic polyphosphate kinase [Flavobacterium psychrophilum]
MNRILFVFVLLSLSLSSTAQIHELGIFAGGANYIGDVGPTDYISPNNLALGVVYKWNKSPRHSWRASFTYGKITSDDADSDMSARQQRGYEFENSVKELSLGLEFNFFDFNLHEDELKITPYVYGGLSYFWSDELYIQNGETRRGDSKGNVAIPMTVGIKSNLFPNFVLGFEVGARYTFTDNLDGSNHKDYQPLAFGNLNSDDWYVFTGFTLTYTFGNKPCYCAN